MPPSIRDTVTSNIRAEMARREVSQTELASALGVTQPNLSKRLRGVKSLDLDEVQAIAARLNVPVTKLFVSAEAS